MNKVTLGSDSSYFPNIIEPIRNSIRLIDCGILPEIGSKVGFKERYTSGKTSHTIHVWWARRPHSSMRLLNYLSLVKSTKPYSPSLVGELLSNSIPSEKIKNSIKAGYDQDPTLLDLFGGGGTIGIEAANLGITTYSIDSNELSVFIQESHSKLMENKDTELLKLIEETGKKILDQIKEMSNPLFPMRYDKKPPLCYLWTYQASCNTCGFQYLLSKRPFLSKKGSTVKAIKSIENSEIQWIEYVELKKVHAKSYGKEYRANSVHSTSACPKCEVEIQSISIENSKDYPVSIVLKENGRKQFVYPNETYFTSKDDLAAIELELDSKIELSHLISQKIPVWNGITNLTLYGITSYRRLYNSRQRILLKMLITLLIDEFEKLIEIHSLPIARLVITPLTSLIDQLIDWNSRLTMWISQNLQPGRAFSGPGVPMYWDYCEIDPLLNGPGNLWGKLNRIISGLKSLPKIGSHLSVVHANAQSVPFDSNFFDAIVTDPPYYDNLYYTVLSDFFYVWKYPLIEKLNGSVGQSKNTSSENELTASRQRFGDNSHDHYCNELKKAINEADRLLKEDGVLSFIYVHSSFLGWDALLYSFQQSSLFVTSVQPLNIERKQRPRAMTAKSVDVCMVFVARKRSQVKLDNQSDQFNFEHLFSQIDGSLRKLGWTGYEIALTLFANGIGTLCNRKDKSSTLDRENQISKLISEVKGFYPNFSLNRRQSL